MSLINVTNLTFSYENSYENIFENVSFQIDTDWKLGLIGRNGRGKTTFFNLLLGKYEYRGSISADISFEYFPYEVTDKNQYTIDVMKEICPKCMDWEMIKETSLLNVDTDVLYRPFCTLSKGEQTKVLLAALFLVSESFLLIDEPTNHLDMEGRRTLGNYLKKKKGFILISHDRKLLDSCVNHIISINRTNIEIQKGNFSSWWDNKSLQDNFEIMQNEKLKKEISRLTVAARRSAGWSDKVEKSKYNERSSGSKIDRGYVGHKSAKAMKRSKNIEARQQEAILKKTRLLQNVETYDDLQIRCLDYHKHCLVEIKDMALFYGNREICNGINFSIHRGDRIALYGGNGCGKSSIVKLICGKNIHYAGKLSVGSGLKISYISQDTSNLKGKLSEFIIENNIDETLFKSILRKLDFHREQFEKNIDDFSSGQKKKVLIAKSLCEKAHLYIWDEPLNFLDFFSRIQIEEMILRYQPTLLFVEHDETFREKIATMSVDLKY